MDTTLAQKQTKLTQKDTGTKLAQKQDQTKLAQKEDKRDYKLNEDPNLIRPMKIWTDTNIVPTKWGPVKIILLY